MGERYQRHFAHHTETACEIERAQQTALHILAKEIIAQEKTIKFPELAIRFEDLGFAQNEVFKKLWHSWLRRNPDHQYNDYIERIRESVVAFDQVTLEKKLSSIIPDIVVQKGEKLCLIEIAVTHFVDEEKKKAIEGLGIATLEIDISEYVHVEITKEELRQILINETSQKRWVFNPRQDALIEKATASVKSVLDAEKQREEKEEEKIRLKIEAERKKREKQAENKAMGIMATKAALIPENYAKIIKALKNDRLVSDKYLGTKLEKKEKMLPFFLNIPICGEMIFKCDRRIWQMILFEKFVFYRSTTDINQDNIIGYLTKRQKEIEIDWRYSYKVNDDFNRKQHHFFKDVITKYFHYLDSLGFIRIYDGFNGFYGEIKVSHSMTPPNQKYAIALEKAIQQADEYSPSVNEDIEKLVNQQMEKYK